MNSFWEERPLKKKTIEVIQINLGNLCNLSCSHCHVEGSPQGKNNMTEETALKIITKLKELPVNAIEFTGGEPILNDNLETFILALHDSRELTVRSNLVSLAIPEKRKYLELLKKYDVRLIGSLPSPFEESTDSQRGSGIFQKSLDMIRTLNQREVEVDLVYNPTGSYIPENLPALENRYRTILKENHEVEFNKFISMVNVPVKRFRDYLEKEGTLEDYYNNLKVNFNPATVERIMCRTLLSIDYRGNIYDCDFNLACGNRVKGYEEIKFWDIDFDSFDPEINFDDYCNACTVNLGSSCQGILVNENSGSEIRKNVEKYYGEILQSSADLKTNACCTDDDLPRYVKESLTYINDESIIRYYGCGSPIPLALEGITSLDVGCGTGRDVFILSKLTGENGHAYGIDMTANQINIARRHEDEQMKIFGYKGKNVTFIHDRMEEIKTHFEKDSLDLVISNCVLNLAENKETVLRQIYHSLKQGGEFYFSDVYADRRIPEEISGNEILYGECLGGALYHMDFERMARRAGFTDPRKISSREITIENREIEDLVENIKFYSKTYRLWKIDGLEDACEDYGHVAIYRGGIPYSPFIFELDEEHVFYKNKPERVCGNTALMIDQSRFGKYFEIIGDFSEHFGLFEDCGTGPVNSPGTGESSGDCC